MTRLHILSDLHLEFSTFEPPATDADVIILAGDIGKVANGVHWAGRTFPDKPIIYVVGNHEFYGTQRTETLAKLHIDAHATGVHLLDDAEVIIDSVRFLGCTLWTDFRLFGEEKKQQAMMAGQNGLNDFRLIHEGRLGPFTPAQSIGLHEKSLVWLKAKIDEPFDGKTVVVTHHMPSMRSVVERFKGDWLSACFASELDYLFGKMDLWIHGHTHSNLDYIVNGTRVICNPRGYVTYRGTENFDFNPGLVVDLEQKENGTERKTLSQLLRQVRPRETGCVHLADIPQPCRDEFRKWIHHKTRPFFPDNPYEQCAYINDWQSWLSDQI